jgi:bla regulator protein blaR1
MDPINEIVVTFVSNALWMTCVIAAVTWLLSRALRQGPSAYRHALWVAALLFAVLLPFVSLLGSRRNDEPRPEPVAVSSTGQPTEVGLDGAASSWILWQRMRHGRQQVLFGPLFTRLVALFYSGFIFYRAVGFYWGWRALRAILHGASERAIPLAVRIRIEHYHASLGVEPVPILWSPEGEGPATLGIRNPVLVLPEWFWSQASEDELSSTLCHELAHVRRHDFLLNLVYELFLLPISFHPAAALIKARIDQTRELACDEIAAESLPTRAGYARSLLSIAQMSANRHPVASGYALGLFDANTLEDRIMNVLTKTNRIRKTWARAAVLAASGLLVATCLGVSGFSVQVTQPNNTDADLRQFVGSWHAKFEGKTFQTIKLEKQEGKLTGTVSHGEIQSDKDGELTSAEEIDGSDPIVEAKLTGGILRVTTKEEDSQDTIEFEMKLTDTDQAELRILTPPDVPTLKPWRLERAKAGR